MRVEHDKTRFWLNSPGRHDSGGIKERQMPMRELRWEAKSQRCAHFYSNTQGTLRPFIPTASVFVALLWLLRYHACS